MRRLFDVRWHTAPTLEQMVLNPIGGVLAMIGLAFHHTTARLHQLIGTAKMVTTDVNCGSSFLKSDLSGELFLDRVEIFWDRRDIFRRRRNASTRGSAAGVAPIAYKRAHP